METIAITTKYYKSIGTAQNSKYVVCIYFGVDRSEGAEECARKVCANFCATMPTFA